MSKYGSATDYVPAKAELNVLAKPPLALAARSLNRTRAQATSQQQGLGLRSEMHEAPISDKTRRMRKGLRTTRRDDGVGLIGLLVGLVILALMTMVAVQSLTSTSKSLTTGIGKTGLTLHKTTSSTLALVGDTPADEVAQANLQAALGVADDVAVQLGGYGDITVRSLDGSAAQTAFTAAASTHASNLSVASTGGLAGGVTFAVQAGDGSCWQVWRSNNVTVFGVQHGSAPCLAVPSRVAPHLGRTAGKSIEWEAGRFPTG